MKAWFPLIFIGLSFGFMSQTLNHQITFVNTPKENKYLIEKATLISSSQIIWDSLDFIDDGCEFDFTIDRNVATNPSQNEFTGLFKSYWPSSWNETYANGKKQVYATGMYKDGIKEGPWKYFLCDGKVKYEGTYKNVYQEGKWMNYDYCHSTFWVSGLPEAWDGFYYEFVIFGDYYELRSLQNIRSEEINFTGGIPHDTLYYRNDQNRLVAKINFKTMEAFYDNNQPLSNQQIDFEYPTIRKSEKKTLEIYHRNGTKAYHMWINGEQINEYFYNPKEVLTKKCKYVNEQGNCQIYSDNGTRIDEYEECFGCGKWGWECPCQ